MKRSVLMQLWFHDDTVDYVENGIVYEHLTNVKPEDKFVAEIAAKVSGLSVTYSDAFNIIGGKIDLIGVYIPQDIYNSTDKSVVDDFYSSCIVVREELRKLEETKL